MRFRLRTLLIAVTVVAVVFGIWPAFYNWQTWRPVEEELSDWLAELDLKEEPVIANHIYGRKREPLVFSLRNCRFIGESDHLIATPMSCDLYITEPTSLTAPPTTRVENKQQALAFWKRAYLEYYGWQWW